MSESKDLTSSNVLLDSDILIDHLRGHQEALDFIASHPQHTPLPDDGPDHRGTLYAPRALTEPIRRVQNRPAVLPSIARSLDTQSSPCNP